MHRALALAALLVGVACTGAEEPSADEEPRAAPATCRVTSDHGETDSAVTAPAGTPSSVRLGPGRDVARTAETLAISRRGDPLRITGIVRAQDCRTPLAGATVEAWQTDSQGRYGPGEACCYLYGVARTDPAGSYTLETVVPARYAQTNPPPRHIHLVVSHPRARTVLTEVRFASDSAGPDAVTTTPDGGVQRAVFDVILRDR